MKIELKRQIVNDGITYEPGVADLPDDVVKQLMGKWPWVAVPLVKIELKHPITHDGIEYTRGVHELPQDTAKLFLKESHAAVPFFEPAPPTRLPASASKKASKFTKASEDILNLMVELNLLRDDGHLIGDRASLDRFCIAADQRKVAVPVGEKWKKNWRRTFDHEEGYRTVGAYLRALVKRAHTSGKLDEIRANSSQ